MLFLNRPPFIQFMFNFRIKLRRFIKSIHFKLDENWYKIKCDHFWCEGRDELTEKCWKMCLSCGKKKKLKEDPICQHCFIDNQCVLCGWIKENRYNATKRL